jgi:hypothetical protein
MDPSVAPGPSVGEQLDDRYRLLGVLRAEDGTDVYEAEDQRLQRRVEVHVRRSGALGAPAPRRDEDGVLDAGEHDGHAFVVFPLRDPGPVAIVGDGPGDDEPTGELPTATDRTAVLPMPLVPTADPSDPPGRPGRAGTLVGALWARRGLLAAVAVVLLVLLAGLVARNDGVEVPTGSTVPVTAETTTTIAPTTTSPPTTQAPSHTKGEGKGKKKKGDD